MWMLDVSKCSIHKNNIKGQTEADNPIATLQVNMSKLKRLNKPFISGSNQESGNHGSSRKFRLF